MKINVFGFHGSISHPNNRTVNVKVNPCTIDIRRFARWYEKTRVSVGHIAQLMNISQRTPSVANVTS